MIHSNTSRLYRALISVAMVAIGSAFLPEMAASQQPVAAAPQNDPGVIKAQADSARLPYTAADIHFMSGMISHHAQAILMSRMAPTHGANDEVRRLAERIINAQTDEIKLMQQWLRDRRQPVPEAKPGPMKMMMNGMEHDMLMPGMLSDAQMKELDAATGSEFDRLFLSYMIQHHRGATSMVKELFESYGAGQDEIVFKFASDVNVDQTTEIARMEKMLASVVFGVRVP
jgi:uncharacterized protein (DUF305 family)